MVKFKFEKSNEPRVGRLNLSEDGLTLAEIIKENNCYYYIIPLNKSDSKAHEDIRINISKIPNKEQWFIKPCNLTSFSEWFQKNSASKALPISKIEKKINSFISTYQTYLIFS
jgi:hypothetical protein